MSPEAPVPVVDVVNESYRLGGAANVVNNLVSLGTKVFVTGVIGNDEMGRQLIKEIRKLGVHPEGIIVETNRPTTVKTRIIAHNQQVVRVDREKRHPIEEDTVFQMLDFVKKHISEIDAILVSDYAKGVICPNLMEGLKELAQKNEILLTVDPKVKNFPLFEGVNIITPNHFEAMQVCGFNGIMDITQEMVQEAGKILLSNFKTQAVLITQGELGMTLFEKNGEITYIPAMAKKVYDVTGAGDTVIATLTAAWASGASLKTAAILANLAAGIVVGEVGTATVSREQLIKVLHE
ncbi:MAG TPA: D-glycero-beta-D-manno-heptose-7-phosphate kinase [Candidatus Desulfofervidus auxilii]|uniref:D-glycero-beta-D-manno-heptose-7-phosphate kinase n=1 Tax=Desulfofervidus auxilii TaxID=1621989 RepID=A0A7C0U484_DESA2|nr:D-glycero-beta-D-manno-heptose-7-phosphate kinase [Candidatus Desulfofervidus auxilii]